MADFGLTHVAHFGGYTLSLSDTGGHWKQPFATVDEQFEREGGFLHLLVHPVWWALRGEAVR